MKTQINKIALVTQANDYTSLANAQLLADEGFHVAITSPVQTKLSDAIEFIGHGAMGLLNDSANIGELFAIYQKVTCYFGGRINLLLLNNISISLLEITDFSEAYFTIQYALPYLDDAAVILLNTGILTKERLNILTKEGIQQKGIHNISGCELTKPSFLNNIHFGDDRS